MKLNGVATREWLCTDAMSVAIAAFENDSASMVYDVIALWGSSRSLPCDSRLSLPWGVRFSRNHFSGSGVYRGAVYWVCGNMVRSVPRFEGEVMMTEWALCDFEAVTEDLPVFCSAGVQSDVSCLP